MYGLSFSLYGWPQITLRLLGSTYTNEALIMIWGLKVPFENGRLLDAVGETSSSYSGGICSNELEPMAAGTLEWSATERCNLQGT